MHNYTKIKGLHSRKITSLPNFSHRGKYTTCSSRDSFAYSESHHDSHPQFPRSSLGTRGLQTKSHRQKKRRKETIAFLESRSAKASSTNNNRLQTQIVWAPCVSTDSARNACHNDPPFLFSKIRRNPPGVLPEKNWVGVCGTLPETRTLFQTKIGDFPYPISDLFKNLRPYRISDLKPWSPARDRSA